MSDAASRTTPETALTSAANAPGSQRDQRRWSELERFLTELLRYQCSIVGGVAGIVFLTPSRARQGGLAATFVSDQDDEIARELRTVIAGGGLERIASTAATSPNGVIDSLPVRRAQPGMYGEDPRLPVVAVPLIAEGRSEGACAILFPARAPLDHESARQRLALTVARFESFLWRERALAEAEQRAMLRETLELLDRSFEGESAEATGSLICHEMKRRFACTRVAIGLIRRAGRIRLTAISGSDEIDRKSPAVGAIEAAMEECADQDAELIYPPPPEFESDPAHRRVTRAHASLSERFGPSSILSLPLRLEGDLVGVVTLERSPEDPFPPGSVPLVRLVSEFIGPAIWVRRLADRRIIAVTRDRLIDLGEAIVGPRYTGRKLLAALLGVLLIVASVPWVPDSISASAEVRARTARVIVPPFEGYLREVLVKPGQTVARGQLLAAMDTSLIEEEIQSYLAQRSGAEVERNDLAASGANLARVRQLENEIEWYDAEIAARQKRIERAAIRAPIDGVISRGDIESLINARVDPTQILFEIIQDDNVAIARVDERDIPRVRHGQHGHLVTTAWPGKKIPVTVTRINPAAEAVDESNVYHVEVALDNPPKDLTVEPGMSGTVKLIPLTDSGRRRRTSLMNMIFGPIVDEIRLRMWW